MTLLHNTVLLTLLICTGFATIVLFIWALIIKVITHLMSRKRRNGDEAGGQAGHRRGRFAGHAGNSSGRRAGAEPAAADSLSGRASGRGGQALRDGGASCCGQ